MIHRGEIVRKEIDKSGFNKSTLADRLGISRGTLYNKLEEVNLGWEFIFQLGKIINHDFSIDFPELRKKTYIISEDISSAEEAELDNYNLPECKKKLEQMRIKYITLFEKYTQLLEKQGGIN
jgi:plasmid maintenance system antidote protein VapI